MNSTIPAELLELKASLETWRTNRIYVREPILRGAPLGGESERAFFAFVTLVCYKHTPKRQHRPSQNRIGFTLSRRATEGRLLKWSGRYFEQIDAFDCRRNHEQPRFPTVRRSLDEKHYLHVWEKVFLMESRFTSRFWTGAHI